MSERIKVIIKDDNPASWALAVQHADYLGIISRDGDKRYNPNKRSMVVKHEAGQFFFQNSRTDYKPKSGYNSVMSLESFLALTYNGLVDALRLPKKKFKDNLIEDAAFKRGLEAGLAQVPEVAPCPITGNMKVSKAVIVDINPIIFTTTIVPYIKTALGDSVTEQDGKLYEIDLNTNTANELSIAYIMGKVKADLEANDGDTFYTTLAKEFELIEEIKFKKQVD